MNKDNTFLFDIFSPFIPFYGFGLSISKILTCPLLTSRFCPLTKLDANLSAEIKAYCT